MNTFEQFIWNYGIMKDFPMKVSSPQDPLKYRFNVVCVSLVDHLNTESVRLSTFFAVYNHCIVGLFHGMKH